VRNTAACGENRSKPWKRPAQMCRSTLNGMFDSRQLKRIGERPRDAGVERST
jgi:hypothetical protein